METPQLKHATRALVLGLYGNEASKDFDLYFKAAVFAALFAEFLSL